jgi:hypothetical protein
MPTSETILEIPAVADDTMDAATTALSPSHNILDL